MARIERDSYGIPQLFGDSVLDLARAQGTATVQDRAWQLEWLRLRSTSGTANVVGGELAEAWDDFAGRMRVIETAQRAFANSSNETQRFVAAYVEGINAELNQLDQATVPEFTHLGHKAGEWEPWMPMASFLAQHLLFGSIGAQLWRRMTYDLLGDDARLLAHEGVPTSGSNAWAVGGERTRSGLPLIGGDPHRNLEQPGVYQQVRLVCTDADDAFDVAGFCFVGVPGVQHFAHAGDVAWAITNAAADHQDVVEVDPDAPLPEDLLELQPGLAVRTTSWVLGDLGFDALLPLLRARTVDDVDRAFDHWVEPVNNLVIADRAGAVRYRIAGRVPTRTTGGAWSGWLAEPHRHDARPGEAIVSANERRGPQSAEIGASFAPPFRADRIHELLADRTDLTVDDFVDIHNDALLPAATILTQLVPGAFDDFDGVMAADSAQAARFAAWRSALVRRLVADPALAALVEAAADHGHGPLFAATFDVVVRVGLAVPTLAAEALAGRAPFGIDVAAHAQAALDDLDDPAAGDLPATWGETHVAEIPHALGNYGYDAGIANLPVDGDQDAVRTMGSYPAVSDAATRGAVARYVWDLADRAAGGWIVPTGAAGQPGAHYADQLEAWVRGVLLPIGDNNAR